MSGKRTAPAQRRRQRRSSPAKDIPSLLRRKRRRSAWRITAIAVSLIVLILVDRGGFLLAGRGDLKRYDGRSFLVTRVIDGDTFDIAAPDLHRATLDGLSIPPATTRVRVWGIDTPEAGNAETPAEPFADQATALATQLLAGQTVTLRLERTRPRGTFGRLVAHAELPGGGQLAERLILTGLARADDRWPHRHLERFALLEQQARRDRVGLWSAPRDSYAPFTESPGASATPPK